VLGPDHRYTLGTRGNLARCQGAAGDPDAAVAGLQQVGEDFAQVLGPDHPMTVATQEYLEDWRRRAARD